MIGGAFTPYSYKAFLDTALVIRSLINAILHNKSQKQLSEINLCS